MKYDNDPRVAKVNDGDYRDASGNRWRVFYDSVLDKWEAYREGKRHEAAFHGSADDAIEAMIGAPR